jgi:hypothetical protein
MARSDPLLNQMTETVAGNNQWQVIYETKRVAKTMKEQIYAPKLDVKRSSEQPKNNHDCRFMFLMKTQKKNFKNGKTKVPIFYHRGYQN